MRESGHLASIFGYPEDRDAAAMMMHQANVISFLS